MPEPDAKGTAFSALTWHYDHRLDAARQKHSAGIPVVGVTSNTVPWELVRAAGFSPFLLSAPHGLTPYADLFMKPVFENRIRNIFDRLLAGDGEFLTRISHQCCRFRP